MAIQADYLGMPLDAQRSRRREPRLLQALRRARFPSAALRRRAACCAIRRPRPARGAPAPKPSWTPVEGKGAVHSYSEVHHAIQPAFKAHTPYLVLLVDLDTQKGKPTEHEALRVVGNLATPDGKLAPPDMVKQGRHRHARAHGVRRRGAGPGAAAMDHRRGSARSRQALALSAGVTSSAVCWRDFRKTPRPPSSAMRTALKAWQALHSFGPLRQAWPALQVE